MSRQRRFIRRIPEPKEIFKLEMKDYMSTHPTTSEYLLLFRGTTWDEDLSAEQIREIMSRWARVPRLAR